MVTLDDRKVNNLLDILTEHYKVLYNTTQEASVPT